MFKQKIGRTPCLMAVVAALAAGCGGTDGGSALNAAAEPAHQVAARASAKAVPAPAAAFDPARLQPAAGERKRALAAPSHASGADQLFAFGERSFPQYFPGTRATQSSGDLLYRYYPDTAVYFVVDGTAQVYVMGGPFGTQLTHVGTVSAFLQTVSGAVNGLLSGGLTLTMGGQTLEVPVASTAFAFPTMLANGTPYTVAVGRQPAGLTCTVLNGSGVAGAGTPSTASVNCSVAGDPLAPPAPVSYGDAAAVFSVDPSGISDTAGGADGDGSADGGADGGAAGGAGDGAPLVRSRVTLTDATGKTVSGLTDQNGRFLLRFKTAALQPPYVLKVIDGLGNIKASVITTPIRANSVVWANINQVTDKIVSDSLRSNVGGTDKSFTGQAIDTAKVATATTSIKASIKAGLAAAGITKTDLFDPLRSRFSLDGSGVDAVLDAVGHTREPQTGLTQLKSRFSPLASNSTGSDGLRLVTESAPLDSTLVALPGSPALTFARLQAWVAELNRCLALSATQYLSDADCVDASGTRLVHAQYRHNSKDFREHLRTLFSEVNGAPVAGSQIRNPGILFVTRSPGPSNDELAYVQLTVTQPYIGPKGPNGPVSGAVEYPVVIVFRREQGLATARAGSWLAYGNQLAYDLSIEPRYTLSVQANPLYQSTPLTYANSSLRLLAIRKQWNRQTQSFVDPGFKAVRVSGPGLPAAGIVLSPGAVCGTATYLPILNKTGTIPAGVELANRVQNDFRLAATNLQGQRFAAPGTYFVTREIAINQIPYLADFSPIRAFSQYKFEIFLTRNPSTSTPDAVEYVRLLAPLMPPELVVKMPMNDPTLSLPLITAGAAAIPMGTSVAVNWKNNAEAAPVGRVSLYAEERVAAATGAFIQGYNAQAFVPGAYSARAVPSAQLLTVPTVADEPNCVSGRIPANDGVSGIYREVTLVSLQGHARVYRSMSWAF